MSFWVRKTEHEEYKIYVAPSPSACNERIDRDYQFEDHTIRGIKKMKLYITMSFIAMLAMAKSEIEENNMERLASCTYILSRDSYKIK